MTNTICMIIYHDKSAVWRIKAAYAKHKVGKQRGEVVECYSRGTNRQKYSMTDAAETTKDTAQSDQGALRPMQ